jgi:hypothetical protein
VNENLEGTTVRYEGITFTLYSITLHRNIWCSKQDTPVQLSLLFITPEEDKFFHLSIPVKYTLDSTDENIILRSWLGTSGSSTTLPTGVTMNELINIREGDVKFTIFNYCLKIKENKTVRPYIYVLLSQPIKFNITMAKDWLRGDPYLSETHTLPTRAEASLTKYKVRRYDEMFNILFNISSLSDPVIISGTERTSTSTQSDVSPAYYSIPLIQLLGTQVPGSLVEPTNQTISSDNIKCYPLNIIQDVNNEGGVTINKKTKKPISAGDLKKDLQRQTGVDPMEANVSLTQLHYQHNVFYIIFLVFFTCIMAILVIIVLMYLFQGTTKPPPIPSS